MPPSLNGQCPSCHRWFETEAAVLRHMNHRSTSCLTWFDYLESISPHPGYPSSRNQSNRDEATRSDDTTHSDEPMLEDEPVSDSNRPRYEDIHPNAPFVFGSGPGFIDAFNSNRHAEKRKSNLYYLFYHKEEWGLASWLSRSGLSMRAIDDFLALPIVRQLSLSFVTAKTLRSRIEDLPKAPAWNTQTVSLSGYETVKPVVELAGVVVKRSIRTLTSPSWFT
ncbi:hypothetical protein BJ322DRAFT_1114538 [Thelephora terrestris]|uniref:Uncharacterized protein n=1 Tax=Thelephora terrestris TaxID=56493 RepID=A0A9P6H2R9_9AGAM|nr:hypothetical protein BJ322DRAFT_1114538 [Thelephora terrestris]